MDTPCLSKNLVRARARWLAISVVVVVVTLLIPTPLRAQEDPPDVASYEINARYDPVTHRITADETAVYVNQTETPLTDLVFHLYLNAFSSAETLWMRETGPGHRGYAFDANAPGWIEVRALQLDDGTPLTLEPLDDDSTLVRAALPEPVAPGDQVTIALAFEAQLPRVFARTGWAADGEFVMAGQWFPKFGVWEDGAWNAYPFHANSEFYADFGSYDVAVTLPDDWVVAATGGAVGTPVENGDGTTTHRFHAEPVIDFAWSASPHFLTLREMAGDVEVTVYYSPGQRSDAERVMVATVEGLDLYGQWYGPYGQGRYPALTVIVVPLDAGGAGGMEYPTLFTVGATAVQGLPRCVRMLEIETVHELGHQWFQSMVATDEAEEPWLDEGFTDYSASRAMAKLEGGEAFTCGGWTLSYLGMQRLGYVIQPETPMAGKAWDFGVEYAIATYAKPVVALSTLARTVGEPEMRRFLRAYVDGYAFKHPSAEDVRAVMAETLGAETATWFFDDLVNDSVTLDAQVVDGDADHPAITRMGEFCLPETVEVESAAGMTTQPWPCDGVLDVEKPAWREITVDADRTVLLDLNLANNGVRRRMDWAAWLGAFARLTQTIQSLFQGGGLQ